MSYRADKIVWHEQFQALPGDANRDGQFDQLDLVQVLQAESWMPDAVPWEEGDWTGDGLFNQQDIIAALQIGHYLQGPYNR